MNENIGNNNRTVELQVKGMTCPGCEASVEKMLSRLGGVKSAKANFSDGTVSVEYDKAVTDIPALEEALGKAGYSLVSGGISRGTDKKPNARNFIVGALMLLAVCFTVAACGNLAPGAKSTGNPPAVQNITSQLAAGAYPTLTVQKGVPVRWDLQADASVLTSCNGTVIIPEFHIEKKLQPGDNIIEFTPTDAGTVPYSCKMGMIHGSIVVADGPSAS